MKRKSRNIKPTRFEQNWGIHVQDLADQEHVTADAIHMRTMKWGTPWQRKAKPTYWENKYGRTLTEISEIIQRHIVSVEHREKLYGNVFEGTKDYAQTREYTYDKTLVKNKFWLHPNHPDYEKERAKLKEYYNGQA